MKILNTILTLICLGGLVSCYPIAGTGEGTKPKTTKTAKKGKIAKEKTASKKSSPTKTTKTTKKKVSKSPTKSKKKYTPKKSTKSKKKYTPKKTTTPTKKKTTPPKPVVKKSVKSASKVPGKAGFVFNPYTNNQVDVRGIPSGTKVRDPHDSNPSHIFRVP